MHPGAPGRGLLQAADAPGANPPPAGTAQPPMHSPDMCLGARATLPSPGSPIGRATHPQHLLRTAIAASHGVSPKSAIAAWWLFTQICRAARAIYAPPPHTHTGVSFKNGERLSKATHAQASGCPSGSKPLDCPPARVRATIAAHQPHLLSRPPRGVHAAAHGSPSSFPIAPSYAPWRAALPPPPPGIRFGMQRRLKPRKGPHGFSLLGRGPPAPGTPLSPATALAPSLPGAGALAGIPWTHSPRRTRARGDASPREVDLRRAGSYLAYSLTKPQ